MTARRLSACKIRGIDPSEVEIMSRVCSVCGKGQTSKVVNDYVCARCLKSNKIERV